MVIRNLCFCLGVNLNTFNILPIMIMMTIFGPHNRHHLIPLNISIMIILSVSVAICSKKMNKHRHQPHHQQHLHPPPPHHNDHLSMSITIGSKRMWAEARRNLRTMKAFSWGPEGTTSRSVRRLLRITFDRSIS